MTQYAALFRIRFISRLQYRWVALGALAARFTWGMMEVLAFIAIYRSSAAEMPMTLGQTVSYVWMQQTLIILFSVVFGDGEIYESISSGAIAYDLTRPMGLYGRWFCQSVGNRLAATCVNCVPAALIACLLPAPYGLTLDLSAARAALFALSAALGFMCVVSFAMIMYSTLFYTISHRGIRIIVTALTSFLSGGIIPLSFFPANALAVVRLLPFASMQNTPLLIFNGALSGAEAARAIGLQAAWFVIMAAAGRAMIAMCVKRVVSQGG